MDVVIRIYFLTMAITRESVKQFASKHLEKLLPHGFGGRFFLAGGCYKSLLHGKEPNDLDLWPASSQDRVLLLDSLQSQGGVVVEDGQFNTVLKNSVYPFRLEVTKKCPRSVKESVADFDILLACVAAEYSNGVVRDVYIHPGIADCISCRQVRAVSRLGPMQYSLRSIERLDRYGKELGYSVCDQSRRQVWDIYTASSAEERKDLLHAAGLQKKDVPPWAAIRRIFIDGRPSEPCRPFNSQELDSLRNSLLFNQGHADPSDRLPVAIFVVGLPGAGKGTVLKEILMELGFSLEEMVDLDMDHIRSFHGQFTQHLKGVVENTDVDEEEPCCHIYKDLVAWFNEGSQAEQMLYREEDSIVRQVLSQRFDFVLPIHTMASLEFVEYTSRMGYVPHVVELRVPLSVATTRTIFRASTTGRYTPPEFLQAQVECLNELLPAAQNIVQDLGGNVISYDNSRMGGGGRGSPERILDMKILNE